MPTKSQKIWLLLGFSLILPYLCYLYFNHTYVFVVPCRYYALAATGPLHILFPHSKDLFLSILPFNLFFTLQNSIISPDKPCLTILTRLNFSFLLFLHLSALPLPTYPPLQGITHTSFEALVTMTISHLFWPLLVSKFCESRPLTVFLITVLQVHSTMLSA